MPKKPIIDVELVRPHIFNVWNSIAGDLSELGPMRNSHAIEACIDANRITMFAYSGDKESAKAAEAEVERAVAEHGYDKVLRSLARQISLI